MKRYRAPGDPGEFGDWIVAVAQLPSEDEAGCLAALQEMVDATLNMKRFTQLPDGKSAMHYTIRLSRDGSLDDLLHERDFWPRAVRFPLLRPLIERYIEQVNSGGEDESWQDEFHPRGSFAIAELALADATACPLLGNLLFRWDMSHETYQEGLIDQLFTKHGFNDHTLDLLACRILADGQAIHNQVAAAMFDHGLRERIDLADFAGRCARFVHRSLAAELGLDAFAAIYAGRDEAAYDAVWSAFHAAGIEDQPEGFDGDDSAECTSYRTGRPVGHWNKDFLDASVEEFDVDVLQLME